jgi:nicotinamidase/pyrazinamidase
MVGASPLIAGTRRCEVSTVVIVIDMVRGFLQEGHPLYCGVDARSIIPCVRQLLQREQEQGSHILYLIDMHDLDDEEFQMFPPHCVRGSSECEIVSELAEFPGEIIPKRRFSCFYDTVLQARLDELQPDKLIVVGVCTDICVMHTVGDARDRGYVVEVPRDCVASFDPEAHAFALGHMEKVSGAQIV